jgi:hypothetical protein
MAKSATNTKPAHERHRATAVRKAGAAIGTASVTATEGKTQADTARAAILTVMRCWTASALAEKATVAEVNTFMRSDFRDMKKVAGKAAAKERLRVHPNSTPAEVNAARRNGSKGLRQRRRPFENFQECLDNDPKLAADSVADGSKLSWSEKCDVWAHVKTARCEESRMTVVIGTDSEGLIHALGENYLDAYEVQTRTLPDGTEQEFCEVTVGPKGATENITVIISTANSGDVYQQMRRVVIESRNLLSNARKFLTDTEDEQTREVYEIPTVAE